LGRMPPRHSPVKPSPSALLRFSLARPDWRTCTLTSGGGPPISVLPHAIVTTRVEFAADGEIGTPGMPVELLTWWSIYTTPPRLPPSSSTTIPDPRTGSHYCTSRFAAGWGEGRPYAGVVSRVACPGDWLCCVGRFPLLSSG
jgi:hypothetical protein